MKKIVAMILALLMILALFAGCGAKKAAVDPSAEGFVFKQGFDMDFPPYSYLKDDGSVGGFDVELCQAVCEYLGWGYEPVPFNWDAKDAELQAGSCDCIWSGFTVEGREDDYCWSIPYSRNTQMILVKKDSGITTLADLAGKSVGVQTATAALDILQDEEGQAALTATFGELLIFDTYVIAFNDLKAGAIDAIAIDATAGSYLIGDSDDYTFLAETLGEETYAAGFRVDDTELAEQISNALKALAESGKIAEIAANEDYDEIRDYLTLG